MFVRAFAISVAFLLSAGQAAALELSDLSGNWETEWSNAKDEPVNGGGPMIVRLDSGSESLDGLIPGPGMDGVMNGEVAAGENGTLIWSGTWVSYWPEGATRGTFRLVFRDEGHFAGTWSSEDGVVQDARWIGGRGH